MPPPENLMTDPANPSQGAPSSDPATNPPATGAGEGGQPEPSGQKPAAEGQGDPAQKPADGEAAKGEKDDKPQGAPESYEFKAPEGVTLDDTVIGAFSEVAKTLDLPQDKAQQVLDKMAPAIASRQAEQFAAARTEWTNSSKADKEFGGDKLGENLAVAKKALDAFSTPELRTLLEDSGLGNHPEVIRMFYRTGKAMSEDRFVAGQGGKDNQADVRRLYSASNMNP